MTTDYLWRQTTLGKNKVGGRGIKKNGSVSRVLSLISCTHVKSWAWQTVPVIPVLRGHRQRIRGAF